MIDQRRSPLRRFRGKNWGAASSALMVGLTAFADDYTKCEVPDTHYASNAQDYCAPEFSGQTRNFTIAKDSAHEHVVFVLPTKNCRRPTQTYRGDLAIILDSSQSLERTDPNDERISAVQNFVDSFANETGGGATQPRLGMVLYAGRLQFQVPDGNISNRSLYERPENDRESDPAGRAINAWTPILTLLSCLNSDDRESLSTLFPAIENVREEWSDPFASDDATNRWNERRNASDPYPLSICEYLPLVSSATAGGGATEAGMSRTRQFPTLASGIPRGATDLSYALGTVRQEGLFGSSASGAPKHVYLITDGLPVVPKRRLSWYCESQRHLPNDGFESDENAPETELYCLDRNFREGVNSANSLVLSQYQDINLHNILFWSQPGESYVDFDEYGTLNPADFLIENSARSGNGRVKFDFAQGQSELENSLRRLIQNLDSAALQRVVISVTDAEGTAHPSYQAVSAFGFPESDDAFDKQFDLKILHLKPGQNVVTVDYHYSDGVVSETLSIDVTDVLADSESLVCSVASSSFTVDGDRKDYPACLRRSPLDQVPEPPEECRGSNSPASCECRAPQGDGFLAFPDENGNVRIFRNSDAANLEFEDQDQFPFVEDFGVKDGKLDPRSLRIQGGTGNCGVVAGQTAEQHPALQRFSLFLYIVPLVLLLLGSLAIRLAKKIRLRRDEK